MSLPIIITTSDEYEHILPIFCYLFNRNWSHKQHVTIVGYKKPKFKLPNNFEFFSLGLMSGNKKDFSNDLAKYFECQQKWFIWMMEDTFIKKVDFARLEKLWFLTSNTVPDLGRINLSNETIKQDTVTPYLNIEGYKIFENTQTAKYRLSTQPSIWNRDFLLQYLKPNLSPWDFETQYSVNDGWRILGPEDAAVYHNEGVRRFDLHNYDFTGLEDEAQDMKLLGII